MIDPESADLETIRAIMLGMDEHWLSVLIEGDWVGRKAAIILERRAAEIGGYKALQRAGVLVMLGTGKGL